MNRKQILSALLAGCMAITPSIPVRAEESSSEIVESIEALTQETEVGGQADVLEVEVPESEELTETSDITEDTAASVDSDPVQAFVVRLYHNILGREADSNGVAAWTNVLKSGKEQGAKVAQGFIESKEFQSRKISDTEYIKLLYVTFLDRSADNAGLNAWKNVLNSGLSRMHVFRGFAESQEFTRICQAYGIQRGNAVLTEPRDQNENVTKFVIRCYQLCLGRNADTAGLNAWCNALLTGQNNAKEVAYGFFFSDEFRNKNLSESDYVKLLYRVLMGREPDTAGWNAWIRAIRNGQSRLSVFNDFGDSDEFQKICASYGVKSGKGSFIGVEQGWKQAYAQKIREYEQRYGVAEVKKYNNWGIHLTGLAFMKLVNFNETTDFPQLLLVYLAPETSDDGRIYSRYYFEIWNYQNDKMQLLVSDELGPYSDGTWVIVRIAQSEGKTYLASPFYGFHCSLSYRWKFYGFSGDTFKILYTLEEDEDEEPYLYYKINGNYVSKSSHDSLYESLTAWTDDYSLQEGAWNNTNPCAKAKKQNMETKQQLGL